MCVPGWWWIYWKTWLTEVPGTKAASAKASNAKVSNTKWSNRVTRESNALDLEAGVFTWDDPKRIALSLKHSADISTRRKATPFRSAMSMLVFYLNRAGNHLDPGQRQLLERAKDELRRAYGKG